MTSFYCDLHFIEMINSGNQASYIEMILPITNSKDKCCNNECSDKVTRKVYGIGESNKIKLPDRKDIILQMFSELQSAIETGCVVNFSAKEIFLPNAPLLTEYKFRIDKEQLVRNLNEQEKGK